MFNKKWFLFKVGISMSSLYNILPVSLMNLTRSVSEPLMVRSSEIRGRLNDLGVQNFRNIPRFPEASVRQKPMVAQELNLESNLAPPPLLISLSSLAQASSSPPRYELPAASVSLSSSMNPSDAPVGVVDIVYSPNPDYTYRGKLFNHKPHGKGCGIRRLPANLGGFCSYDGDWVHGKYHGQATYRYCPNNPEDHVTYEGSFVRDMFEGFGERRMGNGEIYKGDWVEDLMHGEGVIIHPNGEKYEGQFVRNQKHGQGTHHYANGETYRGEWKNDLRHGEGILKLESGKYFVATWEDDYYLKGKLVNPDGLEASKHF